MPTKINDDLEFWNSVEKIAKTVDEWPDWKKEGWAVLDKREMDDSIPTAFEKRLNSISKPSNSKTSFE